ncbi:MAG: phage minor head protein [Candidatus Margulisiibacteriota bacterium]
MHKVRKQTGINKGPYRLEPLPPREAIKFFGKKVTLSAEDFYNLAASARAGAFTVSGVARADVLNDIREAVQKALQDGETLADFRGRLVDIMEQRGWSGTSPWHQETIFRTNIQTAYSAGRWEQIEQVKDDFCGEYDAIDDARTTNICRELNGKIYPLDHPFWNKYTPPNHFNCRSSIRPVSKIEAEQRGLLPETGMPSSEIQPDKGFDVNPAKVQYKPDLSKYPDELRSLMASEGIK